MGILNLKKAVGSPESALWSAASEMTFPSVTLGANVTTPTSEAQCCLPFNAKVLAVSAIATAAGGNGLGINIASGPSVGTFATGTITFSGSNTGSAGTCTVTITGPSGFTQTTTFAIGGTNTATQSAAACVTALNAATNPQVFATNSAGVVTIYQLTPQLTLTAIGTQQQYSAALSAAVATQTVSPTTGTNFSAAGTAALGTPDNTLLGVVPPATASSGQLLLPTFASIPIAASGSEVNTVAYPPQVQGVGSCWDIIFPVTRTLALIVNFAGYDGSHSVTLQVRVLVIPIILDPTHTHAHQWQPNNTTIGAPSTD